MAAAVAAGMRMSDIPKFDGEQDSYGPWWIRFTAYGVKHYVRRKEHYRMIR